MHAYRDPVPRNSTSPRQGGWAGSPDRVTPLVVIVEVLHGLSHPNGVVASGTAPRRCSAPNCRRQRTSQWCTCADLRRCTRRSADPKGRLRTRRHKASWVGCSTRWVTRRKESSSSKRQCAPRVLSCLTCLPWYTTIRTRTAERRMRTPSAHPWPHVPRCLQPLQASSPHVVSCSVLSCM
jgi:hypothetical protein